jgi:outer membrane protein assembly factor BamB
VRSKAIALAAAALSGSAAGGTAHGAVADPSAGAPTPPSIVTARVIDGDTEAPLAGVPVSAWAPGTPPPFGLPGVTDSDGLWPVPDGAAGVSVPAHRTYAATSAGIARRFSGVVTVRRYNPVLQSPEYGGGPQRTRYVPAVDLPTPPRKPTWRFPGKSLLEFPPAVANGVAVLANNSGRVFAFVSKTGRIKWSVRHTRSNIAATPAIVTEKSLVIVAGMDGRLAAYDLRTGKRRWRFSTGGSPIESSPLVVNDTVYVGAWNGRFSAVSVDTGKLRWTYRASDDIKGSAALSGRLVILGDYSGTLHGVNARTGRRVWRNRIGRRLYGGPAISEGRGVIGDVGGSVIAFDPATGRQLWRHVTGNYVYSSPAIANGVVYIGSFSGRFVALKLRTGAVRWSFNAGGRIGGSATVVGKNVYLATLARRGQKDRAFALDAATGRVVWRGADGRYSPAVAAGKTLFIVGRTTLYAYDMP